VEEPGFDPYLKRLFAELGSGSRPAPPKLGACGQVIVVATLGYRGPVCSGRS
jgi:hypothetical protein